MIKKSLEEKIKDVVFWTIAFFILYTIVGFLLETNWLKTVIRLKDVNEILKDSLTITAAFLAPVAAFVLFSDWREEHKFKSIISLLTQIKSLTGKFEQELSEYENAIKSKLAVIGGKDSILNNNNQISILLTELSRLYIEIDNEDILLSKTKQLVDRIAIKAHKSNQNLYVIEQLKFIVDTNEQIKPEESQHLKFVYETKYKEYKDSSKELVDLYDELVIEARNVEKKLI